jgi:hypothetical protein
VKVTLIGDGTLDDTHAMIRRGISFGPVTSNEEKRNGVTTHEFSSRTHFSDVRRKWTFVLVLYVLEIEVVRCQSVAVSRLGRLPVMKRNGMG